LPETVSKGFVFCVMNVEDGDEANDWDSTAHTDVWSTAKTWKLTFAQITVKSAGLLRRLPEWPLFPLQSVRNSLSTVTSDLLKDSF
jgi:hypothetical protein